MEKISWTDRVRNEEVLHTVKEQRNILHTVQRRKDDWIGHILCRNCLLEHVIEGDTEGTRRRGRRHKQLQDNLKEKRWYWHLKEDALDGTLWRTRFGRGCGCAARQTRSECAGLLCATNRSVYSSTEDPSLIGCLVTSYLNSRSVFPMPHPETPYKHRPEAQVITFTKYQPKRGFGKQASKHFLHFLLLNLRQMFKLSPPVSKRNPDTPANQVCSTQDIAGTVLLTCYSIRSPTHPMFHLLRHRIFIVPHR